MSRSQQCCSLARNDGDGWGRCAVVVVVIAALVHVVLMVLVVLVAIVVLAVVGVRVAVLAGPMEQCVPAMILGWPPLSGRRSGFLRGLQEARRSAAGAL